MNTRDNPLVSIITPTYNRADFLPAAVDSVLAQSYGNFELLIVDDGSTDNTRDVLAPYFKDQRVKYFYQENRGQSYARNKALEEASGDFICFLDSDNAWLPDKLAGQLAVFREKSDVEIVYGDTIIINEAGEEISRKNMTRHSGRITLPMLKDNCVSMNTTMSRRRCFDELGGMSCKRRVADDYDLWLRFSARYRFAYIPEYLAFYRVMENQISSDKKARFESNESIIRDFREAFPDALPRGDFNEGFAFFYSRKARYLAATGDRGGAIRSLARAIAYKPFYPAPWRSLLAVLLKRRR